MTKSAKPIEPAVRERADRIIIETCETTGIGLADLLSRSRTGPVVYARQLAAYSIRKLTNLSYPKIGRLLNRHHSTIMYDVAEFDALLHHPWKTSRATRDATRVFEAVRDGDREATSDENEF